MIDYVLLAEAVEFYSKAGFTMVDVPWTVDRPAYLATKPRNSRELSAFGYGPLLDNGGYLAASGEQSFLQMWREGGLPKERDLMCVTPCWRAEERNDDGLHLPYFMKLELMVVREAAWSYDGLLNGLVSLACQFFSRFLTVRTKVLPISSEFPFDPQHGCVDHGSSVDIESLDGVELGSYGVRSWWIGPGDEGTHRWIYGTGVALPRLSQAIEKDKGRRLSRALERSR